VPHQDCSPVGAIDPTGGIAMLSLHIHLRTSVLVCLPLLLGACVWGADSADAPPSGAAPAHAGPPPVAERYPADVFRPRDYVVRSIAESGALLTISGETRDAAPALFAQVRANMPMQGWEEVQVRRTDEMQLLAYEKAGYRARFVLFPQPGGRTQFDLELRAP
jgi:hypothetical protein